MLNVLLVNPPLPRLFNSYLGSDQPDGTTPELPDVPLGLGYLSAALRARDIECHILDLTLDGKEPDSTLLSCLASTSPTLVGFTAMSVAVDEALRLAHLTREALPRAVTVLGGNHATFTPELLRTNPNLDFIAIGEGERTLVDLATVLAEGKDCRAVPGLAYYDGSEVILTGTCRLIEDLDGLPFPARDERMTSVDSQKVRIRISTARGCPFSCVFCSPRVLWEKRWRARSAKNVVDEVIHCHSTWGVQRYLFVDETFTVNRQRTLDICSGITSAGLKIQWGCNSRVDTVDAEMLEAMARAGCEGIYFGVESGDQTVLAATGKGITLEQASTTVRLAKEFGLRVTCSFIIGLPVEITFNCNLKCYYCYAAHDREEEMSTAETTAAIDGLATLGVMELHFTGGEPTLRADLPRLISHALDKGFHIVLQTNGTLLDRLLVDLDANPRLVIDATVHGAVPFINDMLTGVPGSFQRTIRNVEKAAIKGFRVNLKMNVSRRNFDQMPLFERMCRSISVKPVFSFELGPRRNGSLDTYQWRLDDQEWVQLVQQHPQASGIGHRCGAARDTLAVTPSGIVHPCEQIRWPLGKAQDGLERVWHGAGAKALRCRGLFDSPQGCQSCAYQKFCFRCPAIVHSETGDYLGLPCSAWGEGHSQSIKRGLPRGELAGA